jgi:hypothetical protein
MTITKFSKENQALWDGWELMRGTLWVFAPRHTPKLKMGRKTFDARWHLSVVIANQGGGSNFPWKWARSDNYEEMLSHADELNRARGVSAELQNEIIVSSVANGYWVSENGAFDKHKEFLRLAIFHDLHNLVSFHSILSNQGEKDVVCAIGRLKWPLMFDAANAARAEA